MSRPHRTPTEDLGTEKVLMEERTGHLDGPVSARYAHVTPDMRRRLPAGSPTSGTALAARRATRPGLPARGLDRLLAAA